jgi:gamma-glutamyltranspeptidase/glutathione hydrolase
MVVSVSELASHVGVGILKQGGNAVDAAIATAFALAVVEPAAGNIGGGGFLVYRPVSGEPVSYDFRETAPAAARAAMFTTKGRYDFDAHHGGHKSAGVPGTVAGLHLAWRDHGRLPWKQLVEPAIALARDGFTVNADLARSLESALPRLSRFPAAGAQFSKNGAPLEAGDTLKQPDLARTLERLAVQGPSDFYEGETARLIAEEMAMHGGLITLNDLKAYRARSRTPIHGRYRGYDVISMPLPSSGGVTLIQILNVLEGYDLAASGFGSAQVVHVVAESMRRAFADRALYLGDPDFNPEIPIDRLISKTYAGELRKSIRDDHASKSSPDRFTWPSESAETTHLSVVDEERNAVSLTYTLEGTYGSGIVVPGAGFLLNNEMGDFNAAPGLTTSEGLIGTPPNLAAPGKRMLSSMAPTILAKDGALVMVTGSPGGRTIISTVLQTVLNVADFGMNAQAAVDAPRFHHQWLPDRLDYERPLLSPDALKSLETRGHTLHSIASQGAAEVIVVNPRENVLEGGFDRRRSTSGVVGF